MKRLLFSFLFVLTAIAGWAQTTFTQGDFTYTVTDDENHYVSIAKADEAELSGALVIPSNVTYEEVTYAVTSVGASGFNGTGITGVTFPASVTSIGNEAFRYSGLTSITIPASVTSIGDAAFQDCGSMASITIEDSNTPLTMPGSWYERSFWNGATTIYIGRDLTLDGGENNPLLYEATSVEFGPKVTTINPALFYTNTKLASLTIGSGVTTIGESAFNGCGTYWNEETNQGVEELVVTMGNNVTSIGANAFQNCSKLKSITLSSKLTTIGNEAFRYSGLTSITIPASVMTIGDAAFQDCGSMASITIEDSNTPLTMPGSWYERSFWNGATTIYIGRDLTLDGGENNPLLYEATSVEFGPKVTTINPALFYTNTKLASLTIGSGVTTIGESAFNGCGTYWNEETNQGVEELVVTMGNNVTSIGANAFQNCSKLKSITLSSKLTTIGNEAFRYSGLTSITIPASVTSIGDAAFQDCGSMASITIEDSETPLTLPGTYYELPFNNGASTIYIGRNLTLTGDDVSYPLLYHATSVEFGPQMTAIPNYLFSGVTTLSSVKVPWLTPITLNATTFHEDTYTNATLWVPGGTMDAYETATNWTSFVHMDFSSFVVSITGFAHGTLAVGEISSTNNETATTLIDRGEDAVFTVTPATGYEASTFTVNGEAAALTDNSYTVENLSADQTVVAGFTAINYTIGYDLAGGSVASANPTTYTIESSAITLNNPTKTGYSFAGWTGTDLAEPTTSVTIAAGSTGNRSYVATWTPTVYNITLTLDGGTAVNPTTYTIESEDITLNNPTKTGYTFKGWKLNGEGDAQMTVTISTGSTGDKAYTATWQVNQYTITFDSNGGSAVDPITQDYGTVITSPDDPTRTGYDFDGWSPAVPATMPAENMTVVAQWAIATYSVTITGGGVTADNTTPEYGDNVVLTIMDDPDADLISLTVNGNDVTSSIVENHYTISSVTGNVSVVATWNSNKEFITLGSDIATFSCTQDLNFTDSELKAYIAAGYSKDGNEVLLVRVYDVPANTGLVIKGTQGDTYKIPYSTSLSYFVNMLKAHTTADAVPVTEGVYTNFILQKNEGNYVWNHSKGEGTMSLGAKKAYLQLPTSFVSSGNSARQIRMAFEDEMMPTEINNYIMLKQSKNNGRIYNLNGQQMDTMQKGVNIVNGRKILK